MIPLLGTLAALNTAQADEHWQTLPNMPTPRSEIQAAVTTSRIVIPGGIARFRVTRVCEAFDLASHEWTRCPSLPMPLHHIATAAIGDSIYAGGGYLDLRFRHLQAPPLLRLDDGSQSWVTVAQLPVAVGEHSLIALDSKLYLIGGRTAGGNSAQLWRFDGEQWHRLADMQTPRNSFAAVVYDGEIWVLGGRDQRGSALSQVESWNPATNRWQPRPSLPRAIGGLAAAVLDQRIHVLGGELLGRDAQVLADHYSFELSENVWEIEPHLPFPRHGATAVSVGNRIYLTGGARRPDWKTIYSVTGDMTRFGRVQESSNHR